MTISEKISQLRSTIAAIGTQPIKLVAVTKNRSIEEINEVIAAGIEIIAENRIQEAEKKFPHLANPVKKHLIGHLQSNKVKKALQLFEVIQSVDSIQLAEKISSEAGKIAKNAEIFLQVNISRDPAKFGFPQDQTPQALKQICQLPNLQVTGLMTILEQTEDKIQTLGDFKKMKKLFDACRVNNPGLQHLSMGMSDDYLEAIKEGSNMIRIGRHIFTKYP